jgi:hypothetical protein
MFGRKPTAREEAVREASLGLDRACVPCSRGFTPGYDARPRWGRSGSTPTGCHVIAQRESLGICEGIPNSPDLRRPAAGKRRDSNVRVRGEVVPPHPYSYTYSYTPIFPLPSSPQTAENSRIQTPSAIPGYYRVPQVPCRRTAQRLPPTAAIPAFGIDIVTSLCP